MGMAHGAVVHRGHRGRRHMQHMGPELGTDQPPEEKGDRGQGHDAITEAPRHAIGQALNRRAPGLGLFHQSNDACQGGFSTDPDHIEFQGALEVEATGGQFRSRLRLKREGFTGEAGDINRGMPLADDTVHGHAITGEQLNDVTGTQGPDPHLTNLPIREHKTGLIRLQPRQLFQGLAGAEAGPLLEEAPEQDETQQHHRLIEEAGPTDLRPDQGDHAGQIGTGDTKANQGVHAGGANAGSLEATDQNRTARADQRHAGQGRVKGQGPHERNREVAGLAEVAEHGQHQQHQRHHQLTPATPPTRRLLGLNKAAVGV